MSVVGEEQLGSGVSIRRRSWQIEGVSEEGGLGRVFSTGRDVVSASEMVGERALHYTASLKNQDWPRRASQTKKKTGLRRKKIPG